MTTVIDHSRFRQVLGHYPTGVCAVTANTDDGPAVMIVGSFTSVSLTPPLVGFFPDKKSTSWPRIQAAGHFCVNILGADQFSLCQLLASKAADKFATVSHQMSAMGAPAIDDVVARIDCELHTVTDAGDHYFVMGLVKELEVIRPDSPLLFFQGAYGRFQPLG